jgi:hypothetical protein
MPKVMKGRAIRCVIINLVRLIDRHINHLWIRRNNFNVAAVSNHLLLWRGLQVAQFGSRGAQPLDGVHHVRLLIEKGLLPFWVVQFKLSSIHFNTLG